jgi:DNA mismatch repair protein PMS2
MQGTNSFGYRGEAMNSLCCTCDVTVLTTTEPPLGFKLVFDKQGVLETTTRVARKKGM